MGGMAARTLGRRTVPPRESGPSGRATVLPGSGTPHGGRLVPPSPERAAAAPSVTICGVGHTDPDVSDAGCAIA
ncbi:hypothetical protein SAV14893_027580 [Streptomyces avermitilis]|uniref:Uncharacterized protein n=1 Tax=Streptomyces avermitilis TaxID=33903 RepID=A0A4D4LQR7_STRAX|nr:hypothetical protein SAVMC3_39520 [Streptomyces avermitilis]GDY63365.1 hypothetical protein SAV14893_027580 [Streptomyces avermitilis]GDY85437.1 hypothetical protein SAVCW2_46360 [Streptomyces avermitilis]